MSIIKCIYHKLKYIHYRLIMIIINKKINTYKYVHIIHNDKFSQTIVDFFNRNFGNKEHCFIFYSGMSITLFPIPKYRNVFVVQDIFSLMITEKVYKIILHGLFIADVIEYLYQNKQLLSKSCWIIWGGDMYDAPRDKKNDYVRKNIANYGFQYKDNKIYKKMYGKKAKEFHIIIPHISSLQLIESLKQKNKKKFLQIQINNSADKSTLEVLDALAKFSNKNIKIFTVVSYGDVQYTNSIISKGKKIFGDKFYVLDQYLDKITYLKHLSQNDILILNQKRQQGMQNVIVSLIYGTKVFINSDVTTFDYFIQNGFFVEDTNKIINQSWTSFIKLFDGMRKKNIYKAEKYFFNDQIIKKTWQNILV